MQASGPGTVLASITRRAALAAALGLMPIVLSAASAQDYPAKPIRLIVPAAAGLGTDVFARLFANKLQTVLKQGIVIENRPGAGGEAGASEVIRATPDGYTLFVSSSSVMAGNKWLYPRNFNTDTDLVPICGIASTPVALLAGPKHKGKSLKDVIDAAKRADKPLTLATAATLNSVAYGMVREATGVDLLLVRYRSNQQAYVDLMSGDIDLMIDGVPPATPFIQDGRVIGIAVTGSVRSDFIPQVPTFKESGFDVVLYGWSGFHAPKGVSADILRLLNRAGNETLSDPELRTKLKLIGAEPLGGTPEEFRRLVQNDGETWGRMIKRFDLK